MDAAEKPSEKGPPANREQPKSKNIKNQM